MELTPAALKHLDDILTEWRSIRGRYGEECRELGDSEGIRFVTRAQAAIRRIAGERSAYDQQAVRLVEAGGYVGYVARHIVGVVESLRTDVAGGFVTSFTELVHGDLFADFLEMARHLLDEKYKDAAAVIAGSSLEAHLRQLCPKAAIPVEVVSASGTKPKNAEQLNADLAGANLYSKLDQKNVTAWLGLRNKAAHGKYSEYQAQQVSLLIDGIRDFITRHPA